MKKTTKFVLKKTAKYAARTAKDTAVKMATDAALESVGLKPGRLRRRITENIIMRDMRKGDSAGVMEMMRDFYASEAVLSDGSDEIFTNDIKECVSESPFAQGYVFVNEKEKLIGYAMTAHSFSTEYGKRCVWIEDLYLKEEARGMGIASFFLDYILETYPDALHRLEAEYENEHAMEIYKRKDFRELPYVEMVREV